MQGRTTALHLAVLNNFRTICSILIEHGANVNFQDAQGCTPMHLIQSKTVLKLLVLKNGNPLIRNKQGLNPREYYVANVPVQHQDAQLIKKLQMLEEELIRQKFADEINEIQQNNADKFGSIVAIGNSSAGIKRING